MDQDSEQPQPRDGMIKCRVCGEWFDRADKEALYDHLEHINGTSSDERKE